MTTVISRPRTPFADVDTAHRRPLALLAVLAGVVAAGSTLVVCLALGVTGWFLSDAGAHGQPRDGLRVGALGWLMAHRSGIHVEGVHVTAVPLGMTLVCAWTVWRLGHRLGDSVSGHGPDADAIADGARDWTVPVAGLLFTSGYVAVVVTTLRLSATPAAAPSAAAAVTSAVLLCLLVAGPAIAIGSGRAAIWTQFLPIPVRAAAVACRRTITSFLVVSGLVLAVSLVVDWSTAVNVMSQLHSSAGEAGLIVLVCALAVPNAVGFTGSYLLGPGFAVGTHTLVSPTVVVLGPLPMFPLLAALPRDGAASHWTMGLMALPPLLAAVAVARVQRAYPTRRWDEGCLRGCAAGLAAGVVFAVLAWLAGGAVGPGRMQHVHPFVVEALLHGMVGFGLGGLLGGAAMTAWQRHRAPTD